MDTSTAERHRGVPRGTRRRWAFWFFAALGPLAAAYTALWFYAVHRAGREIDAFMTREGARGRVWTCADRQFSGYPLSIAIACRTLGYRRDGNGEGVTLSAGAFGAAVALYDPNRVTATLAGPLDVQTAGATIKVDWRDLRVDLHGLLRPDHATLTLERPRADVTTAQAHGNGSAAYLSLQVRAVDGRSANVPETEIRLDVAALVAPLLDAAFGNASAADLHVGAFLSEILALSGATGPAALENWRTSGGKLDIADVILTKGASYLGTKGVLGLDDAHCAQGTLSVDFAGVDGLMRRFKLPIQALSVGSVLAGFLSEPSRPAPAAASAVTTLPLVLANGRVSLGPIPLPIKLKPLYP